MVVLSLFSCYFSSFLCTFLLKKYCLLFVIFMMRGLKLFLLLLYKQFVYVSLSVFVSWCHPWKRFSFQLFSLCPCSLPSRLQLSFRLRRVFACQLHSLFYHFVYFGACFFSFISIHCCCYVKKSHQNH